MIDKKEFELLLPDALCRARRSVVVILKKYPQDVDDVLQEASLLAFVRLGQFSGRSSFSTWFYRIAINRSLMFLRNRRTPIYQMRVMEESYNKYEDTDSMMDSFPDNRLNPEELCRRIELSILLERALSRLTFRERLSLRLMEFGYGTKEASLLLKQSEEAAKSSRWHARHKAMDFLLEENVASYL